MSEIDRLEYLKNKFLELASRTLPIEKFLRYKKDIMQSSSADKIKIIVKNMVEDINYE